MNFFFNEKFIDKFDDENLIKRENDFLKENPEFITNPSSFKNFNVFHEKKQIDNFPVSFLKTFLSFFFGFFFYFFGILIIFFFDLKKINYFMILGFFLRMFLSVFFLAAFDSVLFSFPFLFFLQKVLDFY